MENNKPTTEEKKYYLGLDIGTNSIGWAVTDENYHLIRKQGKHLWGSRLFDEAQTAKTRRQQREARRRLERRRQRILLLQGIFKPEMDKVDPYFFDRLNNSALHREDKPDELSKSKYLLFTGEGKDGLTDKTYYEKYPTIYHLRLDLIEHPEKKFDLREIYLALAHMVKYRGNFLYDSEMSEESIGSAQNLKDDFDLLDETICNSLSPSEEDADSELPEEIPTFHLTFEEAQKIFLRFQEESRLSLLQESLKGIRPEAFKDPLLGNLLKVITGSKVSLLKLFPEWKEKLEDEENAPGIDFSDEDKWEEILASFPLEDEQKDILLQAKKIYDDRILIHFLKGEKSLSKAMVNRYELHHEQLVQLKKLWKEKIANAPTEEKKNEWKKHYDEFFRALTDEGKGAYASYSNYIGYTSVDGEKETQSANSLNRTTTREDLYKKLKEKDFLPDGLLNAPSIEGSDVTIQTAIDKETYLLRQNARENGAFPYQLNLREMKIILENQKQYYPFLGEKAKDFANPEKESFRICSLLEYRVPYYVGPLSNRQEEKAIRWAVRKPGQEGVRITPWNFYDVIDEKKSALGFLDRLKGKCSYLIGEPTLPSASPIFQEYKVYNEMNSWFLNGEPLKMEDKDYLMENLYRKHRGVSLKNIENTLRKKYNQDVELASRGNGKPLNGEDIHANCSTYFDLKRYLGEDYDRDPKKAALAEEIAEDLTAFEDKKMRRESLIEAGLNPKAANELSNIHYSGWGALSKKFLTGIKTEYPNPSTGEVMEYSILDLLHETNETMMEIYYNSDYTFQEQIEKANESRQPSLDDILEAHNTSPIMKRALIQCVNHLIPELKEILHISQFSSYFIEFTRQEGEKKRTTSRKKFLEDVYKAAKKTLGEEEEFKKTEEQLSKVDEDKLKNKKLYYYFMQLGRDVYTGEKIDLDILLAKNSDYDIDHIIPQALVKDDSFTNTVLVNQSANRHKSDSYPIPQGIVTPEGRKWIKTLNKISIGNRSLMPKEKMDRILRPENRPLDPSEIEGFVNRQLTSTNQSTAAVADVLKESDPDARVVYSRAENVSDFRKLFGLPKCREVNDYHHAHDAYLNIVVGNVFDMVFSRGNNRKFDAEVLRWKDEHNESLKTAVSCVFTRDERKFMTDKLVWKSKKYVLDEQNNPMVDPETGLLIEKNEEPLGDPNRHNQPTIDLVRKTLAFDDPMVTHMATEQSQGGFFSKVTLHSGKANNARYPQKQKAPFNSVGWEKKYGGYGDLTTPYYMVIRSEGKKDKKTGKIQYIYSIEGVPSIYLARKNKEEAIIEYITAVRKRINPKILVPKLLIGTILVLPEHVGINGKKEGGNVRVRITSSNEKNLGTANDTQLHLPKEQYSYFRKIAKVLGTNSPANNKPNFEKYDAVGQGNIKVDKYSSLTQEMNLKTFDVLVAALQRPCFTNLPGVGNTLRDLPKKKNLFTTLSTIKQVIVLQNILMLVGCRTGLQDLSLLGMGTKLGGKLISKTLVPGTKIIFTSTTGFYEKVIFEVPEE